MTTAETIAHSALVAVPEAELTPPCPFCGGKPHARMCGAQRAVMSGPDTLREQLDQAHQHIGALVAGIEHETAAYNDYMHCLDDEQAARLASKHSAAARAVNTATTAARAWLRREAGR